MPTMITYRTSERARDLRSVVVEDLRRTAVLLPGQGSLAIIQGEHQHGKACACRFWAQELGLDVSDRTFAVPADAVVQTRELPDIKTRKNWH